MSTSHISTLTTGYFNKFFHMDKPKNVPKFSDKLITNLNKLPTKRLL